MMLKKFLFTFLVTGILFFSSSSAFSETSGDLTLVGQSPWVANDEIVFDIPLIGDLLYKSFIEVKIPRMEFSDNEKFIGQDIECCIFPSICVDLGRRKLENIYPCITDNSSITITFNIFINIFSIIFIVCDCGTHMVYLYQIRWWLVVVWACLGAGWVWAGCGLGAGGCGLGLGWVL